MKFKDYLIWGGIAFGAWWLFFRKKVHAIPAEMTPEQVVQEAVGPKTPTMVEQSVSQVNAKALSDWKTAFQIAFPNQQITRSYISGELVCVDTAVGKACATLMDALTLGINELVNIANLQGQGRI